MNLPIQVRQQSHHHYCKAYVFHSWWLVWLGGTVVGTLPPLTATIAWRATKPSLTPSVEVARRIINSKVSDDQDQRVSSPFLGKRVISSVVTTQKNKYSQQYSEIWQGWKTLRGGCQESKNVTVPQQHDYYALRHGQSLANVAGVIASNPQVACSQYGLSELGFQQAHQAGHDVVTTYLQNKSRYKGLLILSSDFLRAKETAEQVLQVVQQHNQNGNNSDVISIYQNSVIYEPWLRERWFGAWDGTSDSNYAKVWADDATGTDDHAEENHNNSVESDNVESVVSVRNRVLQGLRAYEQRLQDDCEDTKKYMVLCVAHGDVLQILQTAYSNIEAHLHRTLPHLETATLRPLQRPTPSQ
ncbi:hypothetical protein ACA910_008898 [Epithemia clementina (nom. ined.)]